MKESEPNVCGVCGGDGRLENAWGQVAKCPSCGGSGRRREDTGFHDVTKTKQSHHRNTNRLGAPAEKQTWPSTTVGAQLATEIKGSTLSEETKARLTREIIDHEATHGQVTKTFMKKIRTQLRPPAAR
ncbi:MAG TPA: molecular chaperone DnaJ [Labilithrix sp.]|jgi:hypothetical protein|nr:molecular chaperone DnaJ [Labilithrix sp.]